MTALATPEFDLARPSARPDVLRVRLARENDTELARYGWSQLLNAVGVKHRFTSDAPSAIYYGADERLGHAASIWVQPDESPFEPGSPPPHMNDDGPLRFDLARATAYWLTLASEKAPTPRDEHGRVMGAQSTLGKIGALHSPPIESYAKKLTQRLRESDQTCEFVSRWPSGRMYAVALTHDVDRPERPPSALSDVWRALRFKDGGFRRAYWALASQLRAHGLLGAIGGLPTRRREWDFDEICRFEASLGFRSSFYFSTVSRTDGHPLDVQYDLSASRYRSVMTRLNDGSWETGLHAAYHTFRGQPAMNDQLGILARRTPSKISGVRHHYLLVDPSDPIRSLTEHARAGLLYDTSLGFNSMPGFRCGTALPFQPFHDTTGWIRDFVELPMTIADMQLPTDDVSAAIKTVETHLETVRSLGGLAVLNWHVGHWHSTPAWRESYIAACRMIADDRAAWVTTPSNIANWWLERTAALSA